MREEKTERDKATKPAGSASNEAERVESVLNPNMPHGSVLDADALNERKQAAQNEKSKDTKREPDKKGPTFWGPNEKRPAAAATEPGAVSEEPNNSEKSPVRPKVLRRNSENSSSTWKPGGKQASTSDSSLQRRNQSLQETVRDVPENQSTVISHQQTNPKVQNRAVAYALPEKNDVETCQTIPPSSSSQPGAYSGTPGHHPQRRDNVPFSVLCTHGCSNPMPLTEPTATEATIGVPPREEEANAGLVVAQPVPNEEFQEAEEVDDKNLTTRVQREPLPPRRRTQRINVLAGVLILFVIVILVVILVLRKRAKAF
jgi:hypothetical protein